MRVVDYKGAVDAAASLEIQLPQALHALHTTSEKELSRNRNAWVHVALTLALLPYSPDVQALNSSPRAYATRVQARNGATMVLYLIRPKNQPKPTAIMCFKGSTVASPNAPLFSDWITNFNFLRNHAHLRRMFRYYPKVSAHPGFVAYADEIINEMRMQRLPRDVVRCLRLPQRGRNIWDMLRETHLFHHILCIGHSLGGAMATLLAISLVTDTKSTKNSIQPHLITFGCPRVGNRALTLLQTATVRPIGGLRCFNAFDLVPFVGHHVVTLRPAAVHAGLAVRMCNGALTRLNPFRNHLDYRVSCRGNITVYRFPSIVV